MSAAVFEGAAHAGTTPPLARRLGSADVLADYFERSHNGATGRLNAATKAAMEKDSCECDTSPRGALSFALKRLRREELERLRREFNEGHRLIDQSTDALDKKTTATLRERVDQISWASWFIGVESVDLALDLERRLEEVADVENLLDQAIEGQQQYLAQEDLRRAERREGEKRLEEVMAVREEVAQTAARGRALRQGASQRIAGAQAGFDGALDDLLRGLRR